MVYVCGPVLCKTVIYTEKCLCIGLVCSERYSTFSKSSLVHVVLPGQEKLYNLTKTNLLLNV
jgi:hypothetical protein